MTDPGPHSDPLLAVVAEAFIDRALPEMLDWLSEFAPEVSGVELGSGGYAPNPHCDRRALLGDPGVRKRWQQEFERRELTPVALNAWGNPLHPDRELATAHDAALRETIRLAAELRIDRVVALAGCPAAGAGDRHPHFAAGGWLPYLEGVYERQWEAAVVPYWSALSEFARAEHPELLICLELHPGTVVYNVETFERLAKLGANLAANIDPSHFFWQRMDALVVLAALGERVGHAHAKDVVFNPGALALNGLLDHRWPMEASSALPWKFATVGDGGDEAWWGRLVQSLAGTSARAIAIEHEDPDVPAEQGVPRASRLLARSVRTCIPTDAGRTGGNGDANGMLRSR